MAVKSLKCPYLLALLLCVCKLWSLVSLLIVYYKLVVYIYFGCTYHLFSCAILLIGRLAVYEIRYNNLNLIELFKFVPPLGVHQPQIPCERC
jgi:hypothetical protein